MTGTVAAVLTSVKCGSDAINRALSSIQLFGRASVHNGLVFPSSKKFLELRETANADLKELQPLSCMLQTLHLQRLSVFSLRHPDKDGITDFVTLCQCLMLRGNFNALSDNELCYVLPYYINPSCTRGGGLG